MSDAVFENPYHIRTVLNHAYVIREYPTSEGVEFLRDEWDITVVVSRKRKPIQVGDRVKGAGTSRKSLKYTVLAVSGDFAWILREDGTNPAGLVIELDALEHA